MNTLKSSATSDRRLFIIAGRSVTSTARMPIASLFLSLCGSRVCALRCGVGAPPRGRLPVHPSAPPQAWSTKPFHAFPSCVTAFHSPDGCSRPFALWSGKLCRYLVLEQRVLEVQRMYDAERITSAFIDQYVQEGAVSRPTWQRFASASVGLLTLCPVLSTSDGCVYLATRVDPLFLALPILAEARKQVKLCPSSLLAPCPVAPLLTQRFPLLVVRSERRSSRLLPVVLGALHAASALPPSALHSATTLHSAHSGVR